ncbi:MAG: polymerase, sigma-24 subunit, subfamily [Candidatus Solibacter sp.]|nr:polymerase, sigma-24 subunit, subfamily [Candidatus Solibacter sp.]
MCVSVQPLTDEELVAKYRSESGSPQGERWLNELFQRHHGRVALWCLRITGNREEAADLAQGVFLKAFRYLHSYRGDSKFSTWLYSITRNHCFNEIKARASEPEDFGEPGLAEFVDRAPGADVRLERESEARMVREMVQNSLTEIEGQVFTLHYAEDLPLEAITRLLRLENASGAKAYIVSAKRKLARAAERWKATGARRRHE